MLTEHNNIEDLLDLSLYILFRNILKFANKLKMLFAGEMLKQNIKLLA